MAIAVLGARESFTNHEGLNYQQYLSRRAVAYSWKIMGGEDIYSFGTTEGFQGQRFGCGHGPRQVAATAAIICLFPARLYKWIRF